MKKTEIALVGTEKLPITLDYIIPEKIKGPAVIYAHGLKGFKDWGGMDLVAAEFAKAGMPFIKFNFSHNGTTPENLLELTNKEAFQKNTLSKELNDLFIVLNWFEKDFTEIAGQKLPLALIGHSRGGAEAVLFTSRKPAQVAKLITWAAPAYADVPWHTWPSERMFEWKKTGLIEIENKRTKELMPLGLELLEDFENHKASYNVVKSAAAIKCPWLICHGAEDDVVSPENAQILHEACPGTTLLMVEKTSHTFDRQHPLKGKTLPAATKTLVKACIDFLNS